MLTWRDGVGIQVVTQRKHHRLSKSVDEAISQSPARLDDGRLLWLKCYRFMSAETVGLLLRNGSPDGHLNFHTAYSWTLSGLLCPDVAPQSQAVRWPLEPDDRDWWPHWPWCPRTVGLTCKTAEENNSVATMRVFDNNWTRPLVTSQYS